MKSAQDNLLDILKRENVWIASGELERMEVKNADGTRATGSSITRALRKLREEGKLEVDYRGKRHAHYRPTQTAWKTMRKFIYDKITNTVKEVEVRI